MTNERFRQIFDDAKKEAVRLIERRRHALSFEERGQRRGVLLL